MIYDKEQKVGNALLEEMRNLFDAYNCLDNYDYKDDDQYFILANMDRAIGGLLALHRLRRAAGSDGEERG